MLPDGSATEALSRWASQVNVIMLPSGSVVLIGCPPVVHDHITDTD